MPGASPVVVDSQQLNDQEPTLIEAKEESPKEEAQQGPDLWAPLTEPLKVRVSEKNFEVWLSSVRFFSSDESRLVLHVPNTFFQEYLAEHYTEVIQEELQKVGTAREVVFEVGPTKQEPTPEPNKEDTPQEILPKEDLSTPELRKIAKRKADREQLQAQCYARIHGKYEFMVFKYIDELKLLKAREAEEDRIEAERERAAFKEAWRDQRALPSHFWSDDKTNRKKVRQLVEQLERNKVTETNKPKRE
jgi:chromosomal replication initiation ATPase DnaA